jgi:hypothetical protein
MRPAVNATREQVKTALDSAVTARDNRRVDRLIRSSTDAVEKLTLRKFYPMVATRTLDWIPEWDTPQAWRLWLDENELVAVTAVRVDGVLLAPATYMLRPDTGPPFDRIEINRGTNGGWSSGSTPQRAIEVDGTFMGCPLDEQPAATLAAAVADTVGTSVTVGGSWEIGVGSLLRIGTERLNVTGRSMITTGQTLQVPLDAQLSSTVVTVTTGSAYVEDEVILIDGEKMRVDEIAGNTLVVKRAWDGSVITAHSAGRTIYAARSLTVTRAACGTTAATHAQGDAVLVVRPPDLVNQLVVADTLVSLLAEASAYGRTVGSGDNEREAAGKAAAELRGRVKKAFYRYRTGAV